MTFPAANAIYRRETYDNYPAARAILQVVYEGLQLPMDLALRVESRWFAKILRSPQAAAMIRSLFVSLQELNKGARRPANVPPTRLKTIGVIGAGFMGAGIAYVTALAGINVVLIDRDQAIRRQGQGAFAEAHDRAGRARPRHARPSATRCWRASPPTADYGALKDCDLVIEAVFEDRKVKAEAIARTEAVIGDKVDLRLQHLDAADHLARANRRSGRRASSACISSRRSSACCWSRSSWARRPAMRRSPPRSISCGRSARRRSWSTIRAASTPRAWSGPICAKAI